MGRRVSIQSQLRLKRMAKQAVQQTIKSLADGADEGIVGAVALKVVVDQAQAIHEELSGCLQRQGR